MKLFAIIFVSIMVVCAGVFYYYSTKPQPIKKEVEGGFSVSDDSKVTIHPDWTEGKLLESDVTIHNNTLYNEYGVLLSSLSENVVINNTIFVILCPYCGTKTEIDSVIKLKTTDGEKIALLVCPQGHVFKPMGISFK